MEVQRRKPDHERKEVQIRIRVTAEEKEILTQAAKEHGSVLSSWLRTLGIDHAKDGRVICCPTLEQMDRLSRGAAPRGEGKKSRKADHSSR